MSRRRPAFGKPLVQFVEAWFAQVDSGIARRGVPRRDRRARFALQGELVAAGLDDLAASIAADLHDGHGHVSSESRACDAGKLLHPRTWLM